MVEHVTRLFQHLMWADERVHAALAAGGPAPSDGLRELGHVVAAEEIWLARIEGRAARLPTWPELTHQELGRHMGTVHGSWEAWLRGQAAARLDDATTYTTSTGARFTTAVCDILLHVCLHGQAHRGKVNQLLRRAGREAVPLDYIAFVRQAAAAEMAGATRATG